LADLILGKVDAFEIDFFEDSPFDVLPDWYRLLNCGLGVPLIGASGKDSNVIVLGVLRTYARLPPGEPLSYKGWIEAIRAGRRFVSNGPILSLTVNGQDPGARLKLAAGEQTVRVRAEAHGNVALDTLEIVVNGVAVAETRATGTPISS